MPNFIANASRNRNDAKVHTGRPWMFAATYLVMIPVFALLYSSFSGEFLHATVQYEPKLAAEEQSILATLYQGMVENYEAFHGNTSIPGALDIDWKDVQLFDLRSERPYRFSFALVANPFEKASGPGPSPLRLTLNIFWRRSSAVISDSYAYPIGLEDKIGALALPRILFPLDKRFTEQYEVQQDGVGYVVLPEEFETALREWSEAMHGFPSRGNGGYPRMLYLSAVTITTVGYGDIVPITDRARLAVGAEAVLGIVLAGLFLNSLAQRESPRH